MLLHGISGVQWCQLGDLVAGSGDFLEPLWPLKSSIATRDKSSGVSIKTFQRQSTTAVGVVNEWEGLLQSLPNLVSHCRSAAADPHPSPTKLSLLIQFNIVQCILTVYRVWVDKKY